MIQCYIEKFAFLSLAAFEVAKYVRFKPDVIHSHDWHTGVISALLNDHYGHQEYFANTKTVYTTFEHDLNSVIYKIQRNFYLWLSWFI